MEAHLVTDCIQQVLVTSTESFQTKYHGLALASSSPNVTKQYAHPDQQLSTTPANLPTPTLTGNQSPDPNQDVPNKVRLGR